MKYLSFMVLVAVIFASQYLICSPPNLSIETHSNMQVDLENIIQNAIAENIPNMYSFKMISMKSESIDENNAKVFFTYSYQVMDVSQGGTRTENSGFANLKRLQDNQWSLESAQIEDQKLEFSDPIIITPEGYSDIGAETLENEVPETTQQTPTIEATPKATPVPTAAPTPAPTVAPVEATPEITQ